MENIYEVLWKDLIRFLGEEVEDYSALAYDFLEDERFGDAGEKFLLLQYNDELIKLMKDMETELICQDLQEEENV